MMTASVAGTLASFVSFRACNETYKNYIPKGEVLSELEDCNSLDGEWIQASFSNAERIVYFCKVNTK